MLTSISKTLSSHSSIFVILAAMLAFLYPTLFSWVRGDCASVILGIIMLTMGLTLCVEDIRVLIRRPGDIFIGACAQYTLMPAVAFLLTKLFGLDPYLSIGIILVGCCPGGVSSNIMSYLCKGDVAYSVGMTTASTLLAPLMTPWLVWMLADTRVEVDTIGMFKGILLITLLPVIAGLLCNQFLGKREVYQKIQGVMPGTSVIALSLIVGGVVAQVKPQLVAQGLTLFMLVMAVVFCHNTTGYLLGYNVGRWCRFNTAKRRTLSIEVGMQNAGMATVLATAFFANEEILAEHPEAIICVVPCAVSCAYHSISGTILANLFSLYDKKRGAKEEAA